jgi:SRSO17 transposase
MPCSDLSGARQAGCEPKPPVIPAPGAKQTLLGRAHWDADTLRDVVRDDVVETLAEPNAVLVVDETGFLKQGMASCGVARQYTGSAGKITNCQIGVFAAYVSGKGHAFIDRALYLPKAWSDNPARWAAAHVLDGVAFATKPQLARAMIERAMAADVPFAWVAADSIYGISEIEMALRRAGKGYVLGVSATHPFNSWIGKPEVAGTAEDIANKLDEGAWRCLSAGPGSKGERFYDWAYCELADLEVAEYNSALAGLWTRGLLIRRSLNDEDLAFVSTWCPAGTRRLRRSLPLRGGAGRLRTPSRLPRSSLGSPTTKPAPGTVGTGMSRW